MLADVLGAYLDTLTEREFDAPFFAILRALGFYDLHFLHGPYEFGKDFIAKRDEGGVKQYSFQTKGGNIGLNAWREARGQIDEMLTNNLAHPNFEVGAPRRTIFATTGRLIGAAGVSAQEYRRHLEQRGDGAFEVWDRETLIELIGDQPELGLAGKLDDSFLRIIGEIADGVAAEEAIERFSRSWVGVGSEPPWRAAVSTAVITNRCRVAERLDLAALAALMLLRAAAWHNHDNSDPSMEVLLNCAGDLFAFYADCLMSRCIDRVNDPELFVARSEFSMWATYPVRCIRTAELLALHALRLRHVEPSRAEVAEELIVNLVVAQPGLAHPISDVWAASLIPVGLVVGSRSPDVFARWITDTTRWVAEHYDSGEGLAPLGALPLEELNYLAGSPLEHINLQRRPSSLIASVVLDLVAVLERGDLYDMALNEFLAVRALPEVVEVPDTVDQYVQDAASITRELGTAYDEQWNPNPQWQSAHHHRRCPEAYTLVLRGRAWEHLTLTAVLRDRWFTSTMRGFIPGNERP